MLAIGLLVRKEGIKIKDLISFDKTKWKKDILLGLLFYAIATAVSFGSIVLVGWLVYGVFPAPTSITKLPLAGLLYSFIVFPIIWGFTEEITYNARYETWSNLPEGF